MWSALRRRTLPSVLNQSLHHNNNPRLSTTAATTTTTRNDNNSTKAGVLELSEVEKVLKEVRADDVKVIRVQREWTDYMVLATGRSAWHVKNIAQALLFMAKQKQKGAKRMLLPSVQGQEGGKWIVVDSGLFL